MNTTKIREALEHFKREATYPESPRARLAAAALAEVEAIERGESAIREAALEEAAARLDVIARHAALREAVEPQRTYGVQALRAEEDAKIIRALKSQPARRYLDAEEARRVLQAEWNGTLEMDEQRGDSPAHIQRVQLLHVAQALGLSLDAAPPVRGEGGR